MWGQVCDLLGKGGMEISFRWFHTALTFYITTRREGIKRPWFSFQHVKGREHGC